MTATTESPLRVSKRDASCWFDQLVAPEALRVFFGRPRVSVQLLQRWMSDDELAQHLVEGATLSHEYLFPISNVFPMGFSWSSFVSQNKLLDVCAQAGLRADSILAADKSSPINDFITFAAATDDVMIFSRCPEGTTRIAANRLDETMATNGVVKHSAKDVNDELNATCIGVDLENGLRWVAPGARCKAAIITVSALCTARVASPRQVHNCLGVLQWYELLVRCKLSVYDSIYAFVSRDGEHIEQSIPHQVMSELLMSAFLAVYWSVDITRPFLPLLCASDASTDFGLGGSVVKLPIEQIREMARWAGKRGAFVVLDGGGRMEDYVGRLGEPHLLDIQSEVVTHVFSITCKHPAHINILEGHGFLVLLRWILRS